MENAFEVAEQLRATLQLLDTTTSHLIKESEYETSFIIYAEGKIYSVNVMEEKRECT